MPQPHVADIDFKKMEGRGEMEVDREGDPKEGDRLLLNPKKLERHVGDVIFERQAGRPEGKERGEEAPEGDVLILNPQPVEKHVPTVDIAKFAQREEVGSREEGE